MAVVTLKPRREYSFTDHAVANPSAPPPGDRLDGEIDRLCAAVAQLSDRLNAQAAVQPAAKTPPKPSTFDHGDTFVIAGADPTASALDWAEVSFEWAEHMPDTIPPNILATMGVTGDHWSARWWAHRALEIVEAATGGLSVYIGANPPPGAMIGALWWCTTDGQLYVFYDDLTSAQWVAATNQETVLPEGPASMVPPAQPLYIISPASAAVVPLVNLQPVYVNNLAPLAQLTLKLPPPPEFGSLLEIGFRSNIAALVLQTDTGAAVPGAPVSAFGPGAAVQLRFDVPGWIYWK